MDKKKEKDQIINVIMKEDLNLPDHLRHLTKCSQTKIEKNCLFQFKNEKVVLIIPLHNIAYIEVN